MKSFDGSEHELKAEEAYVAYDKDEIPSTSKEKLIKRIEGAINLNLNPKGVERVGPEY